MWLLSVLVTAQSEASEAIAVLEKVEWQQPKQLDFTS